MKFPVVHTFCNCISLRTGVKTIGFVSIMGCYFIMLITSYELTMAALYLPEDIGDFVIDSSVDIIIQVSQVITSVLLVIGAFQAKHQLLLPWLVSTVINIIAEILLMRSIIGQWFGIRYQPLSKGWIMMALASIVDDVYGWLVVYSYYQTITPPSAEPV